MKTSNTNLGFIKNRCAHLVALSVLCGNLLLSSHDSFARSVFLNGQDISSARQQSIKGANISIDAEGNIFLEAPHYRVQEEKTYTPLSSWIKGKNVPTHQAQGLHPVSDPKNFPLPSEQKVPEAGKTNALPSPSKPVAENADGFEPQNLAPSPDINPKEGSKAPAPAKP